jgi:hypothetical protein
MSKIFGINSWHRTRCSGSANPTLPVAAGSAEELAEEVRQLRAAVAMYRHVAERLMEERRK